MTINKNITKIYKMEPSASVKCQLLHVNCFRDGQWSMVAARYARGALLIEILITISILAVILSLGAQSSFVSLMASKSASDKDTALNFAIETMEAVRGASDEKWQNLYDLTKSSSNHHYPSQSSGKWVISNNGDENLSVGGFSYSRYFIVQNVCRGTDSYRNITGITDLDGAAATCSTSGGGFDPSTQKVSVTVTPTNSNTVSISEYLTRWRNKVCNQTSWMSVGSGVSNCPDTTYTSATNIPAGASLEICQGGC